MWKVILSPEFGDRLDLTRLTRDLIGQKDPRTDLEWVAVEHRNTVYPHAHVVIRGVRKGGEVLRLSRDFVQHGIRNIAEGRCARQPGYRTQIDACESERRQVTGKRFTSIDRTLQKAAPEYNDPGSQYLTISLESRADRVDVLGQMGLAESAGPNKWRLRRNFEEVLRAMQKATDRQRTLAAHGVPMSDERLPIEVLDLSHAISVEGRVLVHGQDEQTGSNYLLLKGTDAKVHFIQYTPELEQARRRGKLRTNSFVRLQ